MSLIDSIRYRLGILFRPHEHDRELSEEIDFHLDLESMQRSHRARDARGVADAPFAARRRFGNVTYYYEESRRATGFAWFDVLWQDMRFAVRSFRRAPTFTVVVVATLAIGIGANTAIFSAFDALLLRPLPFREPDRLMNVSLTAPRRGSIEAHDHVYWSGPKFAVFREAQTAFQDVTHIFMSQFTLRIGDDALRERGEAVDARYLPTLGITPTLGRNFLPAEDRGGGTRVVLLSDGFWQRSFSADPRILGRTVEIDGSTYTIIGVTPAGFGGITGGVAFWISNAVMPAVWEGFGADPYNHTFFAVGRLAPGVSVERANVLVREVGTRVDAAFPDLRTPGAHWGATARELDDLRVESGTRRVMVVLFAAVGLVLLIACANVANLFLVRASGRRREIAVRLAIGASRWRLVRQLLVESVMLSILGGAIGIGVAWTGVRVLSGLEATSLLQLPNLGGLAAIGLDSLRLDGTALAFTAGLALITGVVFGLIPALQATRPSLTDSLKDDSGSRAIRLGGVTSRNVLTVVEITLAVVLLAGSGLMIRSLGHLLNVRTGFDADDVLTLRVNRAPNWSRDSIDRFYDLALRRLSSIPGVNRVAISDCPPLNGGCGPRETVVLPDRPALSGANGPTVGIHWITPDWLALMRVPLQRGRMFERRDDVHSRKAVIVSATAARRLWPGEDPIGRPIANVGFTHGDTAYVIGVVGDVLYQAMDAPPQPEVYISYYQSPLTYRMMLFLRTAGDPAAVAPEVRRALREVAPGFPIYEVASMKRLVAGTLAYASFSAALLGLFAAVAVTLATLGTYGVISFAVAQRTREMGVRIALGATGGDLVRLVVGQGLALGAIGMAFGIIASLAATRALRSMLFDVQPTDPLTYCGTVVVLSLAVVAASWIPARRAAGVPAMQALRAG